MGTISTGNYTIGQVDMYFEATSAHASLLATDPSVASGLGGAFRSSDRDLGNIVGAEIANDVTYIEHFVADKGSRKKDHVAAGTIAVSIPFQFDEINFNNMKRFFLASDLDGGGTKLAVGEKALSIGCAQLYFNTDVGNDIVYFIPKCIIRPDGNLAINDEDWWSGPMVLEILHYETGQWASKPYGMVLASNV